MTYFIVVRLQFEGMHRWPDAPPASSYLAIPHRHMFHIEAEKEVPAPDRSIEFITLKHKIEAALSAQFPNIESYGFHDFGNWSCEMIARWLVELFRLRRCVVFEDGENGGGVEA